MFGDKSDDEKKKAWQKVRPLLENGGDALERAASKLREAHGCAEKAGERRAVEIDVLTAEAVDVCLRVRRLAGELAGQAGPRAVVEAPTDG